MNSLNLKAETREVFGKELSKYRAQKKLPAVIYGPKEKNRPIFVDIVSFKKVWKEAGESSLISLEIDGKKKDVLIYDVVLDPRNSEPSHVDFYAADITKEIEAAIPLVFEGISGAVKNLGGILVKVLHEIEVTALPKDLPHEIKVDISSLNTFEDKITVADLHLHLSAGVKIAGNPDDAVALIEMPREEEAVTEEAPSLADIEVVGRREKAEEETEEGKKEGEPKKKEKGE